MKYNCPKECDFQLRSGGSFDNPEIGGCAIDDRFSEELKQADFEEDDSLPTCPHCQIPTFTDIFYA